MKISIFFLIFFVALASVYAPAEGGNLLCTIGLLLTKLIKLLTYLLALLIGGVDEKKEVIIIQKFKETFTDLEKACIDFINDAKIGYVVKEINRRTHRIKEKCDDFRIALKRNARKCCPNKKREIENICLKASNGMSKFDQCVSIALGDAIRARNKLNDMVMKIDTEVVGCQRDTSRLKTYITQEVSKAKKTILECKAGSTIANVKRELILCLKNYVDEDKIYKLEMFYPNCLKGC